MTTLQPSSLPVLFFAVSLALSACSATSTATTDPAQPSPTAPPSTHTPAPSATSRPSPTASPSRTPLSEFESLDTISFEHAGFSYPRMSGYPETHRPGLVVLGSEDQAVLIGIAGGREDTGLSLEDQLHEFVDRMSSDIRDLAADDPLPADVQGLPALSTDIRGSLFGEKIEGRVTYVIPSPGQFFVMFGNAPTDRWRFEGLPLFLTILDKTSVMAATPLAQGCPISADPTYGYSPENAIRVGEGDPFSGPSLERAYLDQLSGPSGEPVTYERLGSVPQGDTILDSNKVSFGGRAVTLYLDEFSGEPFRVPLRLSCRQ